MHTYRKDGDKWLVGYYTMEANYNAGMAGGVWPSPSMGGGGSAFPPSVVSMWQFLSEHDNEETAMDRVNYLNGGSVTI